VTDELRVSVHEADDVRIVAAHGRVLYDTRAPLVDTLLDLAMTGKPRLVVDLAGVPMCDSSGLNIFVQAHRRLSEAGGWLRLANPQPLVRRVLEVTNVTRLIGVFDSVEAAIAAGRTG
jgi:stage II sporulation protein AA (anti-sigma F factor antagonist)